MIRRYFLSADALLLPYIHFQLENDLAHSQVRCERPNFIDPVKKNSERCDNKMGACEFLPSQK